MYRHRMTAGAFMPVVTSERAESYRIEYRGILLGFAFRVSDAARVCALVCWLSLELQG